MMQISSWRTSFIAALLGMPLLLATGARPAWAVRVADLYAASVADAGPSDGNMQAAFAEALSGVLVKVTGLAAARDPALLRHFGDPSRMVQQFRRDPAGLVWAQFDSVAVRRGLEAAGLPVWGDDRPLTAIWLAYDRPTTGERDVLSATGSSGTAARVREELQRSAELRGVPIVLPLRDPPEAAAVTYADLLAGVTGPVVAASGRYRADAVLVGRAVAGSPGDMEVQWTLLAGEERLEWRGPVSDGPAGLAERLSRRFAASPPAQGGRLQRLAVSGVQTMQEFGVVLTRLRSLDVVESLDVEQLSGDRVVLVLRLRGDPEQLSRALELTRLLKADAGQGGIPAADAALYYRLADNP